MHQQSGMLYAGVLHTGRRKETAALKFFTVSQRIQDAEFLQSFVDRESGEAAVEQSQVRRMLAAKEDDLSTAHDTALSLRESSFPS